MSNDKQLLHNFLGAQRFYSSYSFQSRTAHHAETIISLVEWIAVNVVHLVWTAVPIQLEEGTVVAEAITTRALLQEVVTVQGLLLVTVDLLMAIVVTKAAKLLLRTALDHLVLAGIMIENRVIGYVL